MYFISNVIYTVLCGFIAGHNWMGVEIGHLIKATMKCNGAGDKLQIVNLNPQIVTQ